MDDNNDNEPPLRRSSRIRGPPKHVYEPPVHRRRVKSFTVTPSVSNEANLPVQSQSWCCVAGPNATVAEPAAPTQGSTSGATKDASMPPKIIPSCPRDLGGRKPRSRTVAPKKQQQPTAPDDPMIQPVILGAPEAASTVPMVLHNATVEEPPKDNPIVQVAAQEPPLSPFILPQHDQTAELAATVDSKTTEVSTPGGRKPRSRTVAPKKQQQPMAPDSSMIQPDILGAPEAAPTVPMVSPDATVKEPSKDSSVIQLAIQEPPLSPFVLPQHDRTAELAALAASIVAPAAQGPLSPFVLPQHEPAEATVPAAYMTPEVSTPGRRKPRSRTVAPKKQTNAPESSMVQPADSTAPISSADVAVTPDVHNSPVFPTASQPVPVTQSADSAALASPPARIGRPPRSRTVAKPVGQPQTVEASVPVDASTVPSPPADPTVAVVPMSPLPIPQGLLAEDAAPVVPMILSDAPAMVALPVNEPPLHRQRINSSTDSLSASNDVILPVQSQSLGCVAGSNAAIVEPTPESSVPGRRKTRSRTVAPKKQQQPNAPDSSVVQLTAQEPPFVLPQHDQNAELAAPAVSKIAEVSTPGGRKPRSRTVAPKKQEQLTAPDSPMIQPDILGAPEAASTVPMVSPDATVKEPPKDSPMVQLAVQEPPLSPFVLPQHDQTAELPAPTASMTPEGSTPGGRKPRSRTVAPKKPQQPIVPDSPTIQPDILGAPEAASTVPMVSANATDKAPPKPRGRKRQHVTFAADNPIVAPAAQEPLSPFVLPLHDLPAELPAPAASMTPEGSTPGGRKPRSRTVAPKKQTIATDTSMVQPVIEDTPMFPLASPPAPTLPPADKVPPKSRRRNQRQAIAPENHVVKSAYHKDATAPRIIPSCPRDIGGRKPRTRAVAPPKQTNDTDSPMIQPAIVGTPMFPMASPPVPVPSPTVIAPPKPRRRNQKQAIAPPKIIPSCPRDLSVRKPRTRTVAPTKLTTAPDCLMVPSDTPTSPTTSTTVPIPTTDDTVKAPPKPRRRKQQQTVAPDSSTVQPADSTVLADVPVIVPVRRGRQPQPRVIFINPPPADDGTTIPAEAPAVSAAIPPVDPTVAVETPTVPAPRRRKRAPKEPVEPGAGLPLWKRRKVAPATPLPVNLTLQPPSDNEVVPQPTDVAGAAVPPVNLTLQPPGAPEAVPQPADAANIPEAAVPPVNLTLQPPSAYEAVFQPADAANVLKAAIPPVNLTLQPPSAYEAVFQPADAANVLKAAIPPVNLTLQPPIVQEAVLPLAGAANQPVIVQEAPPPPANVVNQPSNIRAHPPPVNLTLHPPIKPRAIPPLANAAVPPPKLNEGASSSTDAYNAPSSSKPSSSYQSQPPPIHGAAPPPFNPGFQLPRLPDTVPYMRHTYPAEWQHLLTPPPAKPRNPHMDHCKGEVNYIGSFIANGMLAYFAHDAVHYTGNQLHGHSGCDACFGAVTYLQNDAAPGAANAYKEAFERAKREKVQYAYIEGTELKFKLPQEKPAWVEVYKADLRVAETIMMNLFNNSQGTVHDANQSLAAQGFNLFD